MIRATEQTSRLTAASAAILFAVFYLKDTTAQTTEWRATQDSSLGYTAYFESAPISGKFQRFSVNVSADAEGAPCAVEVVVEMDSVAMGGSDINREIRQPEWFDIAGFTQATFHSTAVIPTITGGYASIGTLTLKGVQRTISVPFDWQYTKADQATMVGELELQRLDFNIGLGDWADGDSIGLNVLVRFDLKMEKH